MEANHMLNSMSDYPWAKLFNPMSCVYLWIKHLKTSSTWEYWQLISMEWNFPRIWT